MEKLIAAITVALLLGYCGVYVTGYDIVVSTWFSDKWQAIQDTREYQRYLLYNAKQPEDKKKVDYEQELLDAGYSREYPSGYITGIGRGFEWANAELAYQGRPLLYCTPKDLILTEENFKTIFDEQRKEYPKGKEPIAEVLLSSGLEKTFPCGKRGKP